MIEKIIAVFIVIITLVLGIYGISKNNDDNGNQNISDGSVPEFTEAVTPGDINNVRIFENVSYGAHVRNRFDLCIPGDAPQELGLVLFIHGGAWIMGDKSEFFSSAYNCANNMNVAAATINYRFLSEEVSMTDIVVDIDAALTTICNLATTQGTRITKVMLTGVSAGAHLSMLYAYRCKDTAPVEPAAVFSFCGPTDLFDDGFYLQNSLGATEEVCLLMSAACGQYFTMETKDTAREALDAISPLYYVSSSCCPTAICHGQQDSIVPYSNAINMIEALQQNNVEYDFITFPNSDHALDRDPAGAQQAVNLFYKYITKYLK